MIRVRDLCMSNDEPLFFEPQNCHWQPLKKEVLHVLVPDTKLDSIFNQHGEV